MRVANIPVLAFTAVFALGALLAAPQAVGQEQLMTQQTFNRLERIHDAIDEENYEEARQLIERLKDRTQNDYERSTVLQTSGHLYVVQDDYDRGIPEFERALRIGRLPPRQNLNLLQNLAQLHALQENFERSLDYVIRYIDMVDEVEDVKPSARIYVFGAQAHMAMDNFREALPFIKKGVELADSPNESWYRVWLAIHVELGEYRDAAGVLEMMLEHWPDEMPYWQQLFSMYMELGQEQDAMGALAIPYRNGLFKEQSHYVNLARMHMLFDAPYEAGRVLEDGMRRGIVEENTRHLEMLGRAWEAARETDRAVAALHRLAERKDDGSSHLRIAQLEQQRANWDAVIAAARQAVERGGIDHPGRPLLLWGMAAAEKRSYDEALSAFRRARADEDTRDKAEQWIAYVQEEAAVLR
jgi:tetratricopeptide (TPR) repeat protein